MTITVFPPPITGHPGDPRKRVRRAGRRREPDRRVFAAEPQMYALFAGFAGVFAAMAGTAAHRAWGTAAAVGYACAALVAVTSRTAGRACAFAGAALVPLAVLIATGKAQEEVSVVARSGAALLRHGTPYPPVPGTVYTAYDPYLPGMAVFGLTGLDPRVLFTGVFAAASILEAPARTGPACRRFGPGPRMGSGSRRPPVAHLVGPGGQTGHESLPVLRRKVAQDAHQRGGPSGDERLDHRTMPIRDGHQGAAAVVRVLPALDPSGPAEVADELAGGRQGDAQAAR